MSKPEIIIPLILCALSMVECIPIELQPFLGTWTLNKNSKGWNDYQNYLNDNKALPGPATCDGVTTTVNYRPGLTSDLDQLEIYSTTTVITPRYDGGVNVYDKNDLVLSYKFPVIRIRVNGTSTTSFQYDAKDYGRFKIIVLVDVRTNKKGFYELVMRQVFHGLYQSTNIFNSVMMFDGQKIKTTHYYTPLDQIDQNSTTNPVRVSDAANNRKTIQFEYLQA